MKVKLGFLWDAFRMFTAHFCVFSVHMVMLVHSRSQEGDGCGHTILSPMSGTVASRNYPGTYPNNTQCVWSLKVPTGYTLHLTFGDFDLEWSKDCKAGTLTITDKSKAITFGPLCGPLAASDRKMLVNSSEVTVHFVSHTHRSGRGFLLSYSTNPALVSIFPDLVSCLHRGSHFSSQQIRGSLSDKKLVFNKACDSVLAVVTYNASSMLNDVDELNRILENEDSKGQFVKWHASSNDQHPWLELEVFNRSSITGIVTEGLSNSFIETYTIKFSKYNKTWKMYKDANSKEIKVFEASSDGHTMALNSLFPPITARYLQILPQRWHRRVSVKLQVLGCPLSVFRPRSNTVGSSVVKPVSTETVLLNKFFTESPVVISSSQGCQGVHGKKLTYTESELVSYPLARGIHDILPNPPVHVYAEPDVLTGGQKVGVTFRPPTDEGYTIPFSINHYDTPNQLPEYAEPLRLEPEYATPFNEPLLDPSITTQLKNLSELHTAPSAFQYDCPAHQSLSNGYCTPFSNGIANRVQHQPGDQLVQHTYHEPL
ncbi:Discoidin, CUB and LCCL domain-containing protein 1 [Bagarius yarrelli]|uniref:Discoidin, CUB and LCCL domain-containing protein 1 n=1 Tax=Bagarius yarrelli TaxID=175774 RepID=A0A556V0C8_BAGYA|nr:Discoidin, CUB and LCCL domain-containing protein 1 [Bagarius yarrelli]